MRVKLNRIFSPVSRFSITASKAALEGPCQGYLLVCLDAAWRYLSVSWHALMSSWRLWHHPHKDTATATTFPGATLRHAFYGSTAGLWDIERANVPVWYSPKYLFDLIFR
jgi:hypothetical protein